MSGMRAWLVEDVASDAELIAENLPDFRIERRFQTMLEALDALANQRPHPDVVLADLNLPDSNGLATLDRLLDVSDGTPVVVVTGDSTAAVKAVQIGAHDSLDKSRIDDLQRVVRNAVARTRHQRHDPLTVRSRFFDLALDLLVVMDEDRRPVQLNTAFTKSLGWRLPELSARGWDTLIHPDDVEATRTAFARIDHGDSLVTFEHRFLAADGDFRWLHWRAARDGRSRLVYCVARDISTLMEERDDLRRRVRTDELTGLPNRLALFDHLRESIASHRPFSVLFCDLDGFKTVNDTLGHAAGDEALRRIADRLNPLMRRRADLLARYAGDEFVMVADRTTASRSGWLVERVLDAVTLPMRLGGEPTELGMSIGIAERSALLPDAAALMSAADKALFVAKRAGRNQARRWGPDLRDDVVIHAT